MELYERLAQLKTENGLTTDALAARSGVPKGTLNKLLNGETRNPTAQTLRRLAKALNYPLEALCACSSDMSDALRRCAEHGLSDEDVPRFDFTVRAQDDAMAGSRICRGDIVFIRSQHDVDDGQIAAVSIDGCVTLKRVYHVSDGLQLISDSVGLPPMLHCFGDGASVRILGVAVGFQSRLEP